MELNEKFKDNKIFENRKFKTGLYIETKQVSQYRKLGIDITSLLYEVLRKYGLETAEKSSLKLPIIIESFEKESLIQLAEMGCDLPKIQLMFP